MCAAAIFEPSTSAKRPACLTWLENPYRLVTLLEMLEFSARQFYWIGKQLETIKEDCLAASGSGETPYSIEWLYRPLDEKTKSAATECLRLVVRACEGIEMTITASTATDLLASLEREPNTYDSVRNGIFNLQKLLDREMSGRVFLYVTPERFRFMPKKTDPHVFGETATLAFPSAQYDMHEAGMCMGLARPVAAVFHLMRVLELGLTALGDAFGVSLAHTNWAPAIEQIESRIRDMHKDPAWKALPDWKDQQEFYAQAASHFGILKDAWRNYTAHARGVYTEEKAALIFNNVRAFMQTLATRLHE